MTAEPIDKEAVRAWYAKLRHVLNTEWDPIGGCPDDEYDAYAGKIATMVRDGCSDQELTDYLHWAVTENMGLTGNRDLLPVVVASIRAVGPLK